tara:strand:+ start:13274 stop:13684 length:411 start_codon:yes stop_codon:yes gene_type:complete
MRAVLIRLNENRKQTLGRFFLFDGLDVAFECCTLELPFKANIKNVSCIPTGEYKVSTRNSEKYGDHYLVENVMMRDYILIHPANYYTQLRGCIAVGHNFYDINNDGEHDLTHSRRTMKHLLSIAPNGFELIILNNA